MNNSSQLLKGVIAYFSSICKHYQGSLLPDAAGEVSDKRRQLVLFLIWISRFEEGLAIRISAAVIIWLATEIVSADGAGANR